MTYRDRAAALRTRPTKWTAFAAIAFAVTEFRARYWHGAASGNPGRRSTDALAIAPLHCRRTIGARGGGRMLLGRAIFAASERGAGRLPDSPATFASEPNGNRLGDTEAVRRVRSEAGGHPRRT